MININGVIWNIIFISPYSNLLKRSDGSVTVGMTDCDTKMICIADNVYGEFLRKVLCHELTHAYIYSYGIFLDIAQEEMVCDLLATYARDIIRITDEVYKRFSS